MVLRTRAVAVALLQPELGAQGHRLVHDQGPHASLGRIESAEKNIFAMLGEVVVHLGHKWKVHRSERRDEVLLAV